MSDAPETTAAEANPLDEWATALAERLGAEAVPVAFDTVRIMVERERWVETIVAASTDVPGPASTGIEMAYFEMGAADGEVLLFLHGLTDSKRSFGTTIMVSTASRNSFRPISACRIRFLPSKWKGRDTMPMHREPFSRAIRPITGAAPVPVPPPIPAVTNTRSAPSMALRTSSSFSDP